MKKAHLPFSQNIARKVPLPIALLVLCLLTYGSLAPELGFYYDDWPVILLVKMGWVFASFSSTTGPCRIGCTSCSRRCLASAH